jgi:thioredoxin reductase (NADPH)
MHDVIILGSGPAGLAAAIYTCRENLKTLVIKGNQPGGQLILTMEVENYPGFPEPILGPELMDRMRAQAERVGAEFINGEATSVDFSKRPFKVMVQGQKFEARSIIVATGASAKALGLASEAKLRGRGVSYCATCDGYFFKDRSVAVIGGGDTAVDEALFLTKLVKKVFLVHRREALRATKTLQEKAFENKKIEFIWNSIVEDLLGDERVRGLRLRNVKSGNMSEIECEGVFIAVGYEPNTAILKGQIELDERGYVVTRNETESSVKGVFVAGDVCDRKYRQAVTAAGSGCKAAIDVGRFLQSG